MNTINRKGFTLAEVLITLGIIGVVAAMTLPALIQKRQKTEASSRLKKFVSTFSQAILMAENEYGSHSDWSIGTMNTSQASIDFLNTYIKPYTRSAEITADVWDNKNLAKMKFYDGSEVYVKIGACTDIYYDYNGNSLPNEDGKDRFYFILCRHTWDCAIQPVFRSFYCGTKAWYEQNYPKNRDEMLSYCRQKPSSCSILLEHDNWEFKKDYPW